MKILYVACHNSLEYDEVKLLLELGHEVFSTGDLLHDRVIHREKIENFKVDSLLKEQWNSVRNDKDGVVNTKVSKSFIENFDLVIVCHYHEWIINNIDSLANTRVLIRTIGQNLPNNEIQLQKLKNTIQIIRYSPMERNIPYYAGEDYLIRFYKDANEFSNWIGNEKNIINFSRSLDSRPSFCNFDTLKKIGLDLGIKIFGEDNDSIAPFNLNKISYDNLKQELRSNRVYLHTGTKPASYTLNFIEAFMTGTPIVSVGSRLSSFMGLNLYEVSNFIENGKNGFISDNYNEIKSYCLELLKDEDLAKKISINARESAIKLFGKDKIKQEWKTLIGA